MTRVAQETADNRLVRLGTAGAVAGLVGGLVFGILMAMMGMLPMIAGLVGSQSALVGFLVHMAISLFIGITFGLLFGERSHTFQAGLGWGLVYGLVSWVLGSLAIMPLMLGMGLQFGAAFTGPMLQSLMGHLL